MAPRPVWIDTDLGFDDLAAVALAARDEALEIVGLSAVAGNAPLPAVLEHALRLAAALGLEAPVHAGCERPLVQPLETAENVLGPDGLGTVGEGLPAAAREVALGHGAVQLVEAALARPGELTLVAIGPLTNVALAVRLEPRLPRLLREVVLMGGSTDRGNHTAAAEFNVYADPEAAAIVFGSGADLAMFGLNLTRSVLVRPEHAAAVRGCGRPLSGPLADLLEHYLRIRDKSGRGTMPLHDPAAVAYLLRPDLFRLEPARVEVELRGEHTRGATVCEFRVPARGEPNARVATWANGEAVVGLAVDALLRF